MNVDSILLSEYATLGSDRSLTVIRVFNKLEAPGFPAVQRWLALSLIVHGHRDQRGTEHELEIRLVRQDRSEKVIHQGAFKFGDSEPPPGMPLRHIYVQQIVRVAFEEPGAYAFEVYIDGTYHAATTLYTGLQEE